MQHLIEHWLEVKAEMDAAKELERELRMKIADELFPHAIEGASNMFVGDYKLKLTAKLNRKLDLEALETMDLSEEEEACIKRTPTLNLTAYKLLDDKAILDECLVTTPGLPTLKVSFEKDED